MTGSRVMEANDLIEAAETWIDQRTGRTWLRDGSPVVELVTPYSGTIRLSSRPVASVTMVRTRLLASGSEWEILTENETYFVEDLEKGVLRLSIWPVYFSGGTWSYRRQYEVTYVPVALGQVDPRVELLATNLVSYWLQGLFLGVTGDVKSFSIGDDLNVTFRDGARVLGIPDDVVAMVDSLAPGLRIA